MAKEISALSPGSISDHLVRILCQEAGLVPGQDVKMLYLKTGPEILAALTSGVIDAGIISPPVTLKARQAGFKEIVNVPERNIPMLHAGLATTRGFINEHRDWVRGFLQGYIEAVRYAGTNPKETKQIIGTFTKTTNQEDLEETYQTLRSGSVCRMSQRPPCSRCSTSPATPARRQPSRNNSSTTRC